MAESIDPKPTFGQRVEDAKAKVKKTWEDTKQWCTDNKQVLLMVLVPGALSMLTELGKGYIKHKEREADRQLERDKRKSTWDPRRGCYLRTTRPLTNSDLREIDRRMKNGQTKFEALDDMGLLEDD